MKTTQFSSLSKNVRRGGAENVVGVVFKAGVEVLTFSLGSQMGREIYFRLPKLLLCLKLKDLESI